MWERRELKKPPNRISDNYENEESDTDPEQRYEKAQCHTGGVLRSPSEILTASWAGSSGAADLVFAYRALC